MLRLALLLGVLTLVGCARPTAAPHVELGTVAVLPAPPPVLDENEDAPKDDPAPTADAGAPGPPRHGQRWAGMGVQNDGQTWPMIIDVDGPAAEPCATVVYPPDDSTPIACSGDWQCDPTSTATRLVGVERILEGSDRCIDACTFIADFEKLEVSFDCRQGGVTATVPLRKVP